MISVAILFATLISLSLAAVLSWFCLSGILSVLLAADRRKPGRDTGTGDVDLV